MGSYRTVFLLILSAACGVGSGVFGLFYEGTVTIALFVAFPFVVAALFLSIVHDVVHERASEAEPSKLTTPSSRAASAGIGLESHQSKVA